MSSLRNDKLDALILLSSHVLAEKSAAALLSVDTTDINIPESLNRKVRRMVAVEHWKHDYKELISAGKRIVAVFLIACTVFFVLAMSVKAVRETLWQTLIEWYEDYIAISYRSDRELDVIEIKKEPKNIPTEWKHEVIVDSTSMFYIQFMLGEMKIATYKQVVFDENETWIDNENSTVQEVQINSICGMFVELKDKEVNYLIWTDGEYSYSISGNSTMLNKKALIEIAESVS